MEPIYETNHEDTVDWPLLTSESPLKQSNNDEFDDLTCEEQIDNIRVEMNNKSNGDGGTISFNTFYDHSYLEHLKQTS